MDPVDEDQGRLSAGQVNDTPRKGKAVEPAEVVAVVAVEEELVPLPDPNEEGVAAPGVLQALFQSSVARVGPSSRRMLQ